MVRVEKQGRRVLKEKMVPVSLKMNAGGQGTGDRWDRFCADPWSNKRAQLVRVAARLKEGRFEEYFRRGQEVRRRKSMFKRWADHNSDQGWKEGGRS